VSERTLVVATLDGGDDQLMLELARAGRLPTVAGLLERGVAVGMETPGLELELSVWAPLMSGQPIGNHGLAHFLEFDPSSMGVRIRREGDLEPWWLHLPRHGEGVVAIDVSEMHPHPSSRAEEACGWNGYAPPHHAVVTSPRLRRVLQAVPPPPLVADPHGVSSAAQETTVAADLARAIAIQAAAGTAAGRHARVLCVGFPQFHGLVHWLGHHHLPNHWHSTGPRRPELVTSSYETFDRALAGLLRGRKDPVVALVLARGGRPANQAPALLDGLLERAGLQVSTRSSDGDGAAGRGPGAGQSPPLTQRLRALVPADARERVALAVLPLAAQQRLAAAAFRDSIAWSHTRAFNLPSWDSGFVRVNLEGREVAGTVPENEYGAVLAEVERLAREVVDADTGRPLAADVIRAHDRWPGTRVGCLPDLIVTWAGTRPARRASHPGLGTWEADSKRDLWTEHSGRGLVILAGPGVRRHHAPIEADMGGVAPTLLALAGARRPSVMPAQAWTDVLHTKDGCRA
jgi:hypothetical protein